MPNNSIVQANPMEEPAAWLKQALYAAFGQGSPLEGMLYAGALFIIVFSWTAIGLVFTIILDILFAILFAYNFGRHILAWWRSRG